jgi:hypothetical protein
MIILAKWGTVAKCCGWFLKTAQSWRIPRSNTIEAGELTGQLTA